MSFKSYPISKSNSRNKINNEIKINKHTHTLLAPLIKIENLHFESDLTFSNRCIADKD